MNFKQIQQITNGEWIVAPRNPEHEISTGAFDTRSLGEAQIFFAWKGDHSDGHHYLSQLVGSSIRLIVVEKTVDPIADLAILKVSNSLQALHQMAAFQIRQFKGKVISLTGSSGKTTSKTWLCQVLEKRFRLLANPGSFNNHIGCPLTILSLKPSHDLLILEMGTSGLGELSRLSAIAPADVTLLLNVGHAHLGRFGSLENTYRAKLEIFSEQRPGAVSLIPFADERLKTLCRKENVAYFGQGAPCYEWKTLAIDPERMTQTLCLKTG